MSKAKQQASSQNNAPTNAAAAATAYPPPSSGSFAWGFFLGQLTLAAILFVFIKFFIFGDAPSPDERAAARAAARRQRTLSHTRQRTLSTVLRPHPAAPPTLHKPRVADAGLTAQKILEKTYYHVAGHQPESLDWFNVLVAQTIAQLRADAAAADTGVLGSLSALLNGAARPGWMDEIRVTEVSLGDEFPIFSNCRVMPVDEAGAPLRALTGARGERLQARMDVDLSDVLTLAVETRLLLNYPKPFVMVLPVALAVSVVRFSGTLSLSFSPSEAMGLGAGSQEGGEGAAASSSGSGSGGARQSPTTLTFTFLDDYRLDLSIRSLIGSRARLQDVPKIAQLIEARIHQWFDERCVEPRFQQIVLPSLWPRMKTTRGGSGEEEAVAAAAAAAAAEEEDAAGGGRAASARTVNTNSASPAGAALAEMEEEVLTPTKPGTLGESLSVQRTRDWAAQHATTATGSSVGPGKRKEEMSEIELAGQEMREAEERAKRREQARVRHDQERANLRLRNVREANHDGAVRATN